MLHTAFWLEHRLWGDNPAGYHILNVVLHVAVASLFAIVLVSLAKIGPVSLAENQSPSPEPSWVGAWAAALLFALHPVAVESVAWISEQKNTLSAVFCLVSAFYYLRFETRAQGRDYILALCFFILGVLTKSVTVTLPAVLLVVIWWRKGTVDLNRDIRRLGPWLVVGAVAGLTTAYIERTYVGASGASFDLGVTARLLLAARDLAFYFGKLVWPHPLMFVYPRWSIDIRSATQWLALAVVVLLLGSAYSLRGKSRGPLAALLCYAGMLFPALGFVNVYPFVFSYVADHFQYLASLAVFAAVGTGLTALWRRTSAYRPLVAIGFAAVLVVLSVLTHAQVSIYANETHLYEETLAVNPQAWLAHANLGAILARSGDTNGAIAHYLEAIRLHPDLPQTEDDLGNAYAVVRNFPPPMMRTRWRFV